MPQLNTFAEIFHVSNAPKLSVGIFAFADHFGDSAVT